MSAKPSQTIMRIIARHGPLTNRQIFEHIPSNPELVSPKYLKSKVFVGLLNNGMMVKKISRDNTPKPVWLWNLTPKGKDVLADVLAGEALAEVGERTKTTVLRIGTSA